MLAEDAAVDGLSDPEPLEPLAPVEARPPGDAAEERAGGDGDRFLLEIDRERHGRL